MLIFQKCFEGNGFDYKTFYTSQQKGGAKSQEQIGKEVMAHLQNEVVKDKEQASKAATQANPSQSPGNSVPVAFPEETLRADLERQFYGHPNAQQIIDDQIAEAKAQHDAEFTRKMLRRVKPAGIKVDTPKVEVKPEKIIHPDIPIIKDPDPEMDTTVIDQFQADRKKEAEAAAAEHRANTGIVRGEAQKHLDNAREKFAAGKAKAAETWGKWSENYGEGLTGSLGKDAALAAGGLALAGGAYHLLKKRSERKKAEKEALNNKIKK